MQELSKSGGLVDKAKKLYKESLVQPKNKTISDGDIFELKEGDTIILGSDPASTFSSKQPRSQLHYQLKQHNLSRTAVKASLIEGQLSVESLSKSHPVTLYHLKNMGWIRQSLNGLVQTNDGTRYKALPPQNMREITPTFHIDMVTADKTLIRLKHNGHGSSGNIIMGKSFIVEINPERKNLNSPKPSQKTR